MPSERDQRWRKEDVLTGGEIKAIIEAHHGTLQLIKGDASETARRYTFSDGIGEVGFINPVSEPFCSSCDRIRLTADGQIRTCLFSIDEHNLLAPLRDGATDDQLADIMHRAVAHKEKKHKINEGLAFQRASRSMSQIGG